jgi:hypothetical protein
MQKVGIPKYDDSMLLSSSGILTSPLFSTINDAMNSDGDLVSEGKKEAHSNNTPSSTIIGAC